MALRTEMRDVEVPEINLTLSGFGTLHDAEVSLVSKFSADLRQFALVSTFVQTNVSEVTSNVTKNLSSEFSIAATNIFTGKIIPQFDMIATFGITATPTKIQPGAADLINTFVQPDATVNLVSSVNLDLTSSLSIPLSLPFGLFVDGDATLTTTVNATTNADRFEGVFVDMVSRFVTDMDTDYVEGTNRKFTAEQITAITSNQAQVVDFVEIIVNYQDIDLLVDSQVPIPPILRWNSSGRDLNIRDYKGNVHNYKGKNVLMRLPSIEYNGMFTKKTVKIEINGLLRYFNTAMQLGYLDYAPVTMGKVIYDYDQGTVSQVDDAVLLMRGHVNSFTLNGSPDKQSTTIEIDSGFYDYDRRVATRANSDSYTRHLERLRDATYTNITDSDIGAVGSKILKSVTWGADVVI